MKQHYLYRASLLAIIVAALPAHAEGEVSELTARQIIERAYEYAGGDAWVNPSTLYMEGYGLFWRGTEEFVRYEPYRMWRVFPAEKGAAHTADGRVRIEALHQGNVVFQIAFDGETTYNQFGPLEDQADSDRWASNFGFGVIRHALDDGYAVSRLPDDSVDGVTTYTVQIVDPAGGKTLFAIGRQNFSVRSVAFDTPRGWHRRIYSDFYRNEEGGWLQPGRVRLYYDGVKSNEIYWTSFETGQSYSLDTFQITAEQQPAQAE